MMCSEDIKCFLISVINADIHHSISSVLIRRHFHAHKQKQKKVNNAILKIPSFFGKMLSAELRNILQHYERKNTAIFIRDRTRPYSSETDKSPPSFAAT